MKDYDIDLAIKPIITRLDGHGADIRDLRESMNKMRDLILAKMDKKFEDDNNEHRTVDVRITKLESEKGIFAKIIVGILSFVGGIGGGWIQRHL